MHDHVAILVCSLLIFVFGLFSHLAEKSPITAPMFFVAAGFLVSPAAFGLFHLDFNAEVVRLVAEVTLIVILFVDASMIQSGKLITTLSGLPTRLLGIGLPLTMATGALVLWLLFPELGIWVILMVALILSPTDAALGQAVIKSEKVPERIRESVSIESGLNDGIALPPILVCIAVLSAGAGTLEFTGEWAIFMAQQLTLGPIIGGLVGWLGGTLLEKASQRGWVEPTFQRLAAIPLALLAFAFAEMVHGNGFIAAFFSGLLLGVRTPIVRERVQEFGEAMAQMLSLFIFMILGLVLVPFAIEHWTWMSLLYATLSLTVIRMVPVAISMIGSGHDNFTVGFVGWFGPRGIASVLYLLIASIDLGVKGYEVGFSIIVLTVLMSTFLHGITAVPFTNLYKTNETP